MVTFENLFSRMTVFEFLRTTAIAVTILLVVKHYYDRRRIFKLGSKLPGPKPWPIIGNAWNFLGMKFDILTKLRRYQGDNKLLALWLGHDLDIFLYSPEYAEIFCKSSKLLDRSSKIKLFEPVAGNGLIISNGAQWRKARKLMESIFSYPVIINFIPDIEKQGDILIKRLLGEVGKPKFCLIPYLKDLLFDILSDMMHETKERAQNEELKPVLDQIYQIWEFMQNRLYNPLYHIEFLYKLLPEGRKFYSTLDSMIKYANGVIIEKLEELKEEKNKGNSNANSQKAKKQLFFKTLIDEGLTVSDIREHAFTMIISGTDTTAITISSVLMMLAMQPDIQERAYQEIISIAKGDFTDEKIQQLKYLDMVIKETLRLFPSVPITFRKATEDVQIGDYLIPAGANVGLNFFELHRDPEQYDNPNEFNPDNFLPENVAKRHPFSFIPFGNGLRKCIGPKLAMCIVKIIVSQILLNYKVECDYKTIEDIKFRGDITISYKDNVLVRISERK